jgi:hypothetical protein
MDGFVKNLSEIFAGFLTRTPWHLALKLFREKHRQMLARNRNPTQNRMAFDGCALQPFLALATGEIAVEPTSMVIEKMKRGDGKTEHFARHG